MTNSEPARLSRRPSAPSTPSQFARFERILSEASAMASLVDYESIDMKEIADRAGVALGTLYRYFPSKQYLMGSVMVDRMRRALERTGKSTLVGETAGSRVFNTLSRLFWYYERERNLANVIFSSLSVYDPDSSGLFHESHQLQVDLVRTAATDGGSVHLNSNQERLVEVVLHVFNAVARGAVQGGLSVGEALTDIEFASRLFDALSDEQKS